MGLPKSFALYQPLPPSPKGSRHPGHHGTGMHRSSSLCPGQARRSGRRWGLRAALLLPGQPHVAAGRLCLGSPGRPGAGNRRRAGGPSGGIMGPDNRATDVTLPAICSQHQPCPPCPPPLRPTASPSPGAGSQGQSRAGGGGGLASDGRWRQGNDTGVTEV